MALLFNPFSQIKEKLNIFFDLFLNLIKNKNEKRYHRPSTKTTTTTLPPTHSSNQPMNADVSISNVYILYRKSGSTRQSIQKTRMRKGRILPDLVSIWHRHRTALHNLKAKEEEEEKRCKERERESSFCYFALNWPCFRLWNVYFYRFNCKSLLFYFLLLFLLPPSFHS